MECLCSMKFDDARRAREAPMRVSPSEVRILPSNIYFFLAAPGLKYPLSGKGLIINIYIQFIAIFLIGQIAHRDRVWVTTLTVLSLTGFCKCY